MKHRVLGESVVRLRALSNQSDFLFQIECIDASVGVWIDHKVTQRLSVSSQLINLKSRVVAAVNTTF